MSLTVGIIGCGEITSKARAEQLDAAEGINIGIAMDVAEWAAEDISDRFDVPYTTDEAEVINHPDVDFVYIATPHHLHAEQTIRAARAGKHVVVEKPIATSAADAREMIAVAEEEGVKLSVPLGRFSAGAQLAKEWVENGLIGDVVGTRIVYLGRKPDSYWSSGFTGRIETDWRQRAEGAGGGVLIMNNIHDIDRMRHITGLDEVRVYAEGDTFVTDVEVEDFICVTVRYENGAIGNIESSSFITAGFDGGPYNRIYGEQGTIELANPVRLRTSEDTHIGDANEWHEVEPEPFSLNFFEEFASAVEHDTEVPVPAEDARKDVEVVLGAYRSAERNEPVSLPLD